MDAKRQTTSTAIDPATKRKFRTRNVNSGHWILSFEQKRQHIRWSTVFYSNPAIEYEPIDITRTARARSSHCLVKKDNNCIEHIKSSSVTCRVRTVQTNFFRPYMADDDLTLLEMDPEDVSRYSLRRLQAFFNVYRVSFAEAFTARSDTVDPLEEQNYVRDCLWKRDNQYSYSMYLANSQKTNMAVCSKEATDDTGTAGLKIGWLNVQFHRNKTTAIHEIIEDRDLDTVIPTETWHGRHHCASPG